LELIVLPAIMDISAPAISLADRPQLAIRVTSVRMRREDRSSISSHPLADLGREGFRTTSACVPQSRTGRSYGLGGCCRSHLEAAAASQNTPGV